MKKPKNSLNQHQFGQIPAEWTFSELINGLTDEIPIEQRELRDEQPPNTTRKGY